MWEAIRKNKRRSWILIGVMALILTVLGGLIGAALFAGFSGHSDWNGRITAYGAVLGGAEASPKAWWEDPTVLFNDGALLGAGIALALACLLALFAFWQGHTTLLHAAGAHAVTREAAPRLWNVVEEMTIAAGLPTMPRVFVIDDDAPNAFAAGRSPEHAVVAVTAGLLKRLNRDELQGVVAHEIAHIHNYDIRFMTLASVMLGSIILISEVFLRSLWYGSGRRSSSRREGGGQAQAILMIVAIVFAILAPVVARLLYFACSRQREYLADACSAKFTRYPPGLASALKKISSRAVVTERANKTLAPLYIVNPLQGMSLTGLFATHPPIDKRIGILLSMGGAGFNEYEAAYRQVLGSAQPCFSDAFLASESRVRMREAQRESEPKKDAVERAREALDVIDRAADFLLIPCACGLRMKIPPTLVMGTFKCPRCGRAHDMPRAEHGEDTRGGQSATGGLTYRRTSREWESFKCSCGKTIQLSPHFSAEHVSCKSCGRHVRVISQR